MIGDRHHDIEAARHHGLASIGVLWGFGDRAELEAAGASAIVASAGELAAHLRQPRPEDDEGVRAVHEWFERNSGWAPPDDETMADLLAEGLSRCPDDCLVAYDARCEHGLASWWLVLRHAAESERGARAERAGKLDIGVAEQQVDAIGGCEVPLEGLPPRIGILPKTTTSR